MKLLILSLILLFTGICFQNQILAQETEGKIFEFVEEDASFPGGAEAMQKFINDNVVYPEDCRKEKIKGTVYLSYVIETNGEISSIKIEKGVHPSIDAEAIRLISIMPEWKPGKNGGKTVRCISRLPIKFSLRW